MKDVSFIPYTPGRLGSFRWGDRTVSWWTPWCPSGCQRFLRPSSTGLPKWPWWFFALPGTSRSTWPGSSPRACSCSACPRSSRTAWWRFGRVPWRRRSSRLAVRDTRETAITTTVTTTRPSRDACRAGRFSAVPVSWTKSVRFWTCPRTSSVCSWRCRWCWSVRRRIWSRSRLCSLTPSRTARPSFPTPVSRRSVCTHVTITRRRRGRRLVRVRAHTTPRARASRSRCTYTEGRPPETTGPGT